MGGRRQREVVLRGGWRGGERTGNKFKGNQLDYQEIRSNQLFLKECSVTVAFIGVLGAISLSRNMCAVFNHTTLAGGEC